ncbi:response regulator transcription factor [Agaribacterium sp. ZY112]|uniref:response regulator transcription factor n=1 Tax=Agaribacterium sp. ZY112 TaxID=3233574 RepID=UPI0035261B96
MKAKLLIIEDDECYATALQRRMIKHGFNCIWAKHASDALLLARQHLPSFVLLDMKLEHESGMQLIRPLRNVLPQSRIVLLTGFASIATAVDAIKLGADDYLSKPADTNTLLRALGKVEQSKSEEDDVSSLSARQAEWEHIQQALKFNKGNISATARQLNMHRRTLQRKLNKKPGN